MIEAVATPNVAVPKVGKTVAVALLMGLSIQVIGTLAWVALIRLNVRERPDVPWAAATQACLLALMLVWLSGHGWPRSTSAFRRFRLRLWQPQPAGRMVRRQPGDYPGADRHLARTLRAVCT